MALIILVIVSALPIASSGAEVGQRASGVPNWTFMVYMDADNTLSDYAADDLAEMMSYGSNSNLTILVMYDSTSQGDSAIYLIEKGKKTLLENLGEVDMGSEDTLTYFLNWTLQRYHSKYYFLDLWDHGNYYSGACVDHGDWLTLSEIRDALANFQSMHGKKLDVLGFDACRMGGIEIYYALSSSADYIVASEKDEPATGWPYYDILSKIEDKNPENASRLVVDSMYNWAKKFYAEDGLSVVMASVNTSRMPRFMENFNSKIEYALPVAPYLRVEIMNRTSDVERYELSTVADLYDLMSKIDKVGDYKLSRMAESIMSGVENMTYSRAWDCPNPANGYHAKNAHGIGIYYPVYSVEGGYYYTDFAKDSLWDEFLRAILYTEVENASGDADVNVENDVLTVNYTTTADYVEIYIDNMSGGYSGVMGPNGRYQVHIDYGTYTVFIYGYNVSGYVVWRFREKISHLREIKIMGKFYLNDRLVEGARITVKIGNYSFETLQNESGFSITVHYPEQIRDNSTLTIHVEYGYFSRDYTYRLGALKGSDVVPVVIRDQTFPSPQEMLISTILITLLAIVIEIRAMRR